MASGCDTGGCHVFPRCMCTRISLDVIVWGTEWKEQIHGHSAQGANKIDIPWKTWHGTAMCTNWYCSPCCYTSAHSFLTQPSKLDSTSGLVSKSLFPWLLWQKWSSRDLRPKIERWINASWIKPLDRSWGANEVWHYRQVCRHVRAQC